MNHLVYKYPHSKKDLIAEFNLADERHVWSIGWELKLPRFSLEIKLKFFHSQDNEPLEQVFWARGSFLSTWNTEVETRCHSKRDATFQNEIWGLMEFYVVFVMQEVYSGFMNVWTNDHRHFLIKKKLEYVERRGTQKELARLNGETKYKRREVSCR